MYEQHKNFPCLKSCLGGTRFNHRTKIRHAIAKMLPVIKPCWFM